MAALPWDLLKKDDLTMVECRLVRGMRGGEVGAQASVSCIVGPVEACTVGTH